jgi:hypothetical protein
MRSAAVAIAAMLLACGTPPERNPWQVVENDHFVFYGQPGEAEVRATFLALERFRAAVEAGVGIRPPRKPRLRVVLFASSRAAGGILEGGWAGGFAANLGDGDVVVTSLARPRLERLYVEAILSGRAPYWYAQGMADLLSTLRVHDGNVTIGLPPRGYAKARPRAQVEEEAEESKAGKQDEITGRMLVTDEGFKPGAPKRRRDYWMLVHFLLLASQERAEGLREYLRLWQLGVASPEAFENAIGRSAEDLYREEVARYAERGFKARSFPLVGYAPDVDARARPAEAAELRGLLEGIRAWQARHEAPAGDGP